MTQRDESESDVPFRDSLVTKRPYHRMLDGQLGFTNDWPDHSPETMKLFPGYWICGGRYWWDPDLAGWWVEYSRVSG